MSAPADISPAPRLPEDGIGERIRVAREQMGLSQVKFADLTKQHDIEHRGIPRSVLVGYEAGKHKPGARELRILASALEIDVATLLYGSGSAELEADMARVDGILLSGALSALPAALRVGLGLMRLKEHEREAFATLIQSMVVKTFKRPSDADLLRELVELIAMDMTHRLADKLPGANTDEAIQKALISDKGLAQLVEAMGQVVDALPGAAEKQQG